MLDPEILFMLFLVGLMVSVTKFFRGFWFHRKASWVNSAAGGLGSPVDGRLVYHRIVEPGKIFSTKLGEDHYAGEVPVQSLHVGIYMTPFDRHFVFSPIAGVVSNIEHWKATANLPMLDLLEYWRVMLARKFDDWMSRHGWITTNERVRVDLDTSHGPVSIIMIADKYVNKVDIMVKVGQTLEEGTALAFIGRGSQTDFILPSSFHCPLPVGSKLKIGSPLVKEVA